MSLAEINKEYEDIMHNPNLDDRAKTMRLSDLMDKMRLEFNIPLFKDEEWERKNPAVIAMFRKIANSRDL